MGGKQADTGNAPAIATNAKGLQPPIQCRPSLALGQLNLDVSAITCRGIMPLGDRGIEVQVEQISCDNFPDASDKMSVQSELAIGEDAFQPIGCCVEVVEVIRDFGLVDNP